jgi:NADPH2 dehydrogenase
MSAEPFKLTRIPTLKTPADFRRHVASLNVELPCEDGIISGPDSPLAQPVPGVSINGKTIANRWAIQPMEGWDATTDGAITEEVRRRWQRFGESGASVIYGGEAMAVRADGRANPNQLIISDDNKRGLAELREILLHAHKDRFGSADHVIVGFQLTHSGRFCRPHDKKRLEPRIAYRHPILDKKFGIASDDVVLTDSDVEQLVDCYIRAARIASDVGADFVDIKHCHGYLLHEFLGAHNRPGKYGGALENRTGILRDIVAGIRAGGNKIDLGVRLSAFDFVPFRPDPARSQPGKLGPGIPEDFSHCLPYRYGFGVKVENPVEYDLTEPFQFMDLCRELGIRILNLSAGSPYYNPHIQRPAAYPPSDGYQPAHDPLIDVARQINVVRQFKTRRSRQEEANPVIIGTGYSYLQEYLPHVAQYVVRHGWSDMIGLGRMTLAYPGILSDAVASGALNTKIICRTFSDCTTAPRNGLISGCYPLDKYYSSKPEFQKLKEIKKAAGV